MIDSNMKLNLKAARKGTLRNVLSCARWRVRIVLKMHEFTLEMLQCPFF